MKIRWLGAKRPKIVDLPIGLSSIGDKYGEVVCNPVGEFPVSEARKLLAMPGASALYALEDEYERTHAPTKPFPLQRRPLPAVEPPADDPVKIAQRERGRKLAEIQKKKREEKAAAAAAGA